MPHWLLFLTVAIAQAQLPVAPRDTSTPPALLGAISGRITERESGQPIPRAVVALLASGSSQPVEVVTDAQGRYEFTGLAPGEYGLWAGPEVFKSTFLRQAFGRSAPMEFAAMWPKSGVTLKAGERRSGVDLALTRALGIDGRITDVWDEPVAEAEVTLLRQDGTPSSTAPVYTDDRGEYRLFGLVPGRYHVCAVPQGMFPVPRSDESRYVRTCHPSALTDAEATDVVLTSRDAVGIDIRIQRTGTYSVAGSVTDASGGVATGARVWASSLDDRGGGGGAGATAGGDGRFVLKGLTPGRYFVWASIGGPRDPSDPKPPAREHELGHTPIDLGNADVSDVVVSLSKGQRVTGRVVFDGGPPSPPKQLRMGVQMASPASLWPVTRDTPRGSIDDELNFEVTGLFRLPLVVMLFGLPEGWIVRSVTYDGQDVTARPIDFGAEARDRRLQIRVTNRVAAPSVRVIDDQGNPVATPYHIALLPVDSERWEGTYLTQPSGPGRDGLVKLNATLPGDYFLAAVPPEDFRLLRDRSRWNDLVAVASRVSLIERDDRVLDVRLSALPAARR
jgi:hypothetical protein